MRNPEFCICKNKGADQRPGTFNRSADQRFCFRCIYSTIPLFSESKMSVLWLYSPFYMSNLVLRKLPPKSFFFFVTQLMLYWQGIPKIHMPLSLRKWAFICAFVVRMGKKQVFSRSGSKLLLNAGEILATISKLSSFQLTATCMIMMMFVFY